jgi:probable rRNA maturation factor
MEREEDHHADEPSGAIHFFSEELDWELEDPEAHRLWIEQTAGHEGLLVDEISYIFCSDEYLLGINQQYLQHDDYTDILTFPYSDSGNALSGDIYISIDRVRDNARRYKVDFEHELRRVMIHGVLHLLGYIDHSEEDKAFMRAKEDFYLARFTAPFTQ